MQSGCKKGLIAGIEIIDSAKAVASVFTEILLFMVWFPAIVYGLYRVVIALWDASLKPQRSWSLLISWLSYTAMYFLHWLLSQWL